MGDDLWKQREAAQKRWLLRWTLQAERIPAAGVGAKDVRQSGFFSTMAGAEEPHPFSFPSLAL